MVHRVQVRPISNGKGNKLLRIVRRSSGSVVTYPSTGLGLDALQA
jgi:hypothetical protein